MPLFESQESRNTRLMREADLGIVQRLVIIGDSVGDSESESQHGAWLAGGGVVAAASVKHLASIRQVWVKGDLPKALALNAVFTLPMISRWYRLADKQASHAEEDKRRAREIAATNVLRLLRQYSDDRLRRFMQMDIQYSYEADEAERSTTAGLNMTGSLLLLSEAVAWCAGHPGSEGWPKEGFPLKDIRELYMSGWGGAVGELGDMLKLAAFLSVGTKAMVEYYQLASQGKRRR